ncbi:MAG: hypothetical protein IKR25_13175 [Muribaculaceae bacterium]|nr:hypothetical protein [Muribaculaceae bacterium]
MVRVDCGRRYSCSYAYDRILKVARTIADLEAAPTVQHHHINEAVG